MDISRITQETRSWIHPTQALIYRPTQLQESSPTRRHVRGHALLSGEVDTIVRVKVRELCAVPTSFHYSVFFSYREMNSRLICFVSIFCNLGKSYAISLIRDIDDVYRLIEKIKRRGENRYVAPYGHGKLKKNAFL